MAERGQQARAPFEHYAGIYQKLDPAEIAQRCGLSFDSDNNAFNLRIMGHEYRATFPQFKLIDSAGVELDNPWEKILFVRYLCEGKYFPAQGKQLAYTEIPWGNVYYKNFEGRCLKRCASAFGKNIPAFKERIAQDTALNAVPLNTGDAGYRFEFTNGLYIGLLLWAADEDFPPSAQILFDDNFVFAFTAEDIAVIGDIFISRLRSAPQLP